MAAPRTSTKNKSNNNIYNIFNLLSMKSVFLLHLCYSLVQGLQLDLVDSGSIILEPHLEKQLLINHRTHGQYKILRQGLGRHKRSIYMKSRDSNIPLTEEFPRGSQGDHTPLQREELPDDFQQSRSDVLSLSLPMDGKQIQFNLNPVDLAAPGLSLSFRAVEGHSDEDKVTVPHGCFHAGGDDEEWAVISTCSTMNGVVESGGKSYHISELPNVCDDGNELRQCEEEEEESRIAENGTEGFETSGGGRESTNRTRRSSTNIHQRSAVYILYPLDTSLSEYARNLPINPDFKSEYESRSYTSDNIETNDEYINKYSRSRSKRRVTPEAAVHVIELGVFVDRALYKYVSKRYPNDNVDTKTVEIVMTMINAVHRLFSSSSLGKHQVSMQVKKIEVLGTVKPSHSNGNVSDYLINFCEWQSRENPVGESQHWDHGLLLTGNDLWTSERKHNSTVGLAFVGGMCSVRNSCTINEARSLMAAYVIAHELGHSLGMSHDDGIQCVKGKYLMAPTMSSGATKWSSCSKKQLKKFISSRGDCLKTTPLKVVAGRGHGGKLPGKRFDADHQCHYMYGDQWKHYTNDDPPFNNVCHEIWCRNNRLLKTPTAPALEGTSCGDNKVCSSRAVCITDNDKDSKNSINGRTFNNKHQVVTPKQIGDRWMLYHHGGAVPNTAGSESNMASSYSAGTGSNVAAITSAGTGSSVRSSSPSAGTRTTTPFSTSTGPESKVSSSTEKTIPTACKEAGKDNGFWSRIADMFVRMFRYIGLLHDPCDDSD